MTLGARAVLFDGEGRVCLVRHSYVRGWHLPGGGVEPGETIEDALRREVREETGIAIEGRPTLHGVFFNRSVSRRDHVAVYVVHGVSGGDRPSGGREIIAHAFFPPNQLPPGTTGATRRRLAEILRGTPPEADW